jgi:hypothetical protein
VGDRVQPGLEFERPLVAAHRRQGANEGLLHHVLRPLLGEEPRAMAQERPSVSGHDRLERGVVAGSDQVHQPFVALRAEQGHAGQPGGG